MSAVDSPPYCPIPLADRNKFAVCCYGRRSRVGNVLCRGDLRRQKDTFRPLGQSVELRTRASPPSTRASPLWRPALIISGDQEPSLPHSLGSLVAHADTPASTGEEIGEGGSGAYAASGSRLAAWSPPPPPALAFEARHWPISPAGPLGRALAPPATREGCLFSWRSASRDGARARLRSALGAGAREAHALGHVKNIVSPMTCARRKESSLRCHTSGERTSLFHSRAKVESFLFFDTVFNTKIPTEVVYKWQTRTRC